MKYFFVYFFCSVLCLSFGIIKGEKSVLDKLKEKYAASFNNITQDLLDQSIVVLKESRDCIDTIDKNDLKDYICYVEKVASMVLKKTKILPQELRLVFVCWIKKILSEKKNIEHFEATIGWYVKLLTYYSPDDIEDAFKNEKDTELLYYKNVSILKWHIVTCLNEQTEKTYTRENRISAANLLFQLASYKKGLEKLRTDLFQMNLIVRFINLNKKFFFVWYEHNIYNSLCFYELDPFYSFIIKNMLYFYQELNEKEEMKKKWLDLFYMAIHDRSFNGDTFGYSEKLQIKDNHFEQFVVLDMYKKHHKNNDLIQDFKKKFVSNKNKKFFDYTAFFELIDVLEKKTFTKEELEKKIEAIRDSKIMMRILIGCDLYPNSFGNVDDDLKKVMMINFLCSVNADGSAILKKFKELFTSKEFSLEKLKEFLNDNEDAVDKLLLYKKEKTFITVFDWIMNTKVDDKIAIFRELFKHGAYNWVTNGVLEERIDMRDNPLWSITETRQTINRLLVDLINEAASGFELITAEQDQLSNALSLLKVTFLSLAKSLGTT